MSDVEKARDLFKSAGLAFPTLPDELASSLREREEWVFATRSLDRSPYALLEYVQEACEPSVSDYALVAHSGHGVNSYAIQYYLLRGGLRMFLFLGWGGIYMDSQEQAALIAECFAVADRIAHVAASGLRPDTELTVVASDFYGSSWLPSAEPPKRLSEKKTPQQVLGDALAWLETQKLQK